MRPPIREIAGLASFHTGVGVREIEGSSRAAYVMRPRWAVYWTAIRMGHGFAPVGRAIGNRDHKTIIVGVRRAEELRARDPAFRRLTDRLLTAFTALEEAA